MAALGAMGFSVLYQIRGRKLLFCMLGGGLAWLFCLALSARGASDAAALLGASAFASAYSELMARILKAPATVFCVPAVIPLVPGATLYYAMVDAVEGDWAAFGEKGFDALSFAAAIACGILAVISVNSLIRSFAARRKRRRGGCA